MAVLFECERRPDNIDVCNAGDLMLSLRIMHSFIETHTDARTLIAHTLLYPSASRCADELVCMCEFECVRCDGASTDVERGRYHITIFITHYTRFIFIQQICVKHVIFGARVCVCVWCGYAFVCSLPLTIYAGRFSFLQLLNMHWIDGWRLIISISTELRQTNERERERKNGPTDSDADADGWKLIHLI